MYRWLLECARCGRRIDERLYLVDNQPPSKAVTTSEGRKTPTASVDAASNVAQPASSHLDRNDGETTTVSSKSGTEPRQPSSDFRHNDNVMPAVLDSSGSKTASTSLSKRHRNSSDITTAVSNTGSDTPQRSSSKPRQSDTKVAVESNDSAVPSAAQKTGTVTQAENVTDKFVNSAKNGEAQDQNLDIRRSDINPHLITVTVDVHDHPPNQAVDITGSKEILSAKVTNCSVLLFVLK